jgi:hypothetical protein
VLELLSEQGPRLPQAVAHKNVSVANGGVRSVRVPSSKTQRSKHWSKNMAERQPKLSFGGISIVVTL